MASDRLLPMDAPDRALNAEEAAHAPRVNWMRVGALAALATTAAARMLAAVHGSPAITPDSFGFASQSKLSVFDPRFWGSQHPPLLALLWKLDPAATTVAPLPAFNEIRPLIVLNVIVGVACWGFLAHVVAANRRTTIVRVLAFLVILGLSLSPAVAGWDHALLSESVSLSLEALAVACALGYLRNGGTRWLAALSATVLAVILARETNTLLALPLAVPVLVAARTRWRWAVVCALALGLAVTAWGQHASKERTWIPLRNSLLVAMYVDGYKHWFQTHGMPVGSTTGALLFERPSAAFLADPRARPLLRWMESDGSHVWYTFLAEHWRYTARPIRHPGRLVDGNPAPNAPYLEDSPLLTNVVYPHGVAFWLFAAIGGAALFLTRRTREASVAVALGVFTVVLAFLVPNLDPLDQQRHAIGGEVAARLAAAIVILAALDLWASRGGSSRDGHSPL